MADRHVLAPATSLRAGTAMDEIAGARRPALPEGRPPEPRR